MPGGRPTDYSPEICARICSELAEGKSMRKICEAEDAPAMTSVFKWLRDYPEFSQQYNKSKEQGALALFEELVYIADTPVMGERRKETSDGKVEITIGDMIEHRKLQIDARKWALSKILPKKYGERLQQDVTINDYTAMSSEERRRKIIELQRQLDKDGG